MKLGLALDIGIWVGNLLIIGFFLVVGFLTFIERMNVDAASNFTTGQLFGLFMMILALVFANVLVFPILKRPRVER